MINKEDVCLVLYYDRYYSIIEVNISPQSKFKNITFLDELSSLGITRDGDELYYSGKLKRTELKKQLIEIGFKTKLDEE